MAVAPAWPAELVGSCPRDEEVLRRLRRIEAEFNKKYVATGEVMSLAADLGHLRDALKLICPDTDWSWLATIIKRIAVTAPRTAGKYHLVTSEISHRYPVALPSLTARQAR